MAQDRLKIETAADADTAIEQMKNGEMKSRQVDFTVVCHDLTRGMGSLLLQVSRTGNATFRYAQKVEGKRTYTVIGRYTKKELDGLFTLKEARARALEYGALAMKGINVKKHLQEKAWQEEEKKKQLKKEQELGSFGQLIDSYIQSMKRNNKRTWSDVFDAIKRDVFPFIPLEQKAKSVTDDQIVEVLARMINRGATVQSNRVRSYLHAAFNIGLKHDKDPAKRHLEVTFGLNNNPVSHIPKQSSAESAGERYLDRNELKTLLKLLDECVGISKLSSNIVKLCLFSGGQRPYELLTIKPEKLDFESGNIEIAAQYSKNKRSHVFPMTKTIRELVTEFDKNHEVEPAEFLIYKRTNLQEHFRTDSLQRAVTRLCIVNGLKHFTPRDLRRTCKTHMASLGISKETRDRLQNHAFTDVSSKHYDRWDYIPEKLEALQKWEKWLLKLKVS